MFQPHADSSRKLALARVGVDRTRFQLLVSCPRKCGLYGWITIDKYCTCDAREDARA